MSDTCIDDIEEEDMEEDCPFCTFYDDLFSQMRDEIAGKRVDLMRTPITVRYLQ